MVSRLILVDDGNPRDLTGGKQFVEDAIPESSWISYPDNKGKGFALRAGLEKSRGDIIMYTDHDFPYTYGTMLSMIDVLLSGKADAVIGIRDEHYYDHISWGRKWISRILKWTNERLLTLPTNDTQCGLKVFNHKGRDLFMTTRIDRYLIDLEFLCLLEKSPLTTALYEVKVRDDITLSPIRNLRLFTELYSYYKLSRRC